MKDHTRIDVFANMDEVMKFYEWARQHNPKTRDDMVRLLGEYKKPDLVVKGFKEHIEAKLMTELNKVKPEPK